MSKSHLISLISPFDMDFELISATAQLHCFSRTLLCWTFRVKCTKLDISVSCHFYFDFLFLPFICPSMSSLSCECHSCCFLLSLCEACLPCSKSAVFPPSPRPPRYSRPLLCEYSSCCHWQCLNCKSAAGVSSRYYCQIKARGAALTGSVKERLHRPEITIHLRTQLRTEHLRFKSIPKGFSRLKC